MNGCDVAIVGAGLIGCAAAFYLQRAGRRVIVLDQTEINRGASGRNAGSLHFQIEPRMVDVLISNPERLRDLIPLNLRAVEDWRSLAAELGCELELAMHGGLMLAETERDQDLLLRKVELEIRSGLPTRMLDRRDLRRIAPYLGESVQSASYLESEGHANPRLVTTAYARAARALGAEFRLGTRVSEIAPHPGGWHLAPRRGDPRETSADGIRASALLIAAGAWSVEILKPLGVAVPLVPVGLQMMVTQRAPPLIAHLIQHMGRRLSIKQLSAGNILIGGGWPAHLPGKGDLGERADAELQAQAMIGSAAVAARTIPATLSLNIIRSWSGIASVAPDHLPVLGAIESLPGVYIAAGGSSFTLGPTYARLVSELISTGSTSMPIRLYRPERFERSESRA